MIVVEKIYFFVMFGCDAYDALSSSPSTTKKQFFNTFFGFVLHAFDGPHYTTTTK